MAGLIDFLILIFLRNLPPPSSLPSHLFFTSHSESVARLDLGRQCQYPKKGFRAKAELMNDKRISFRAMLTIYEAFRICQFIGHIGLEGALSNLSESAF